MIRNSGESRLSSGSYGTRPEPTFDQLIAPWVLDDEDLTLEHGGYSLAAYEWTSPAEVLDDICQIAGKSWASDEVLAGLVFAIEHIVRPQESLCSGGVDSRLANKEVATRVKTARARYEGRQHLGRQLSRMTRGDSDDDDEWQ